MTSRITRRRATQNALTAIGITAAMATTSCDNPHQTRAANPPEQTTQANDQQQSEGIVLTSEATDTSYAKERRLMVTKQLAARDIVDRRVLAAMLKVPRHEFVPADLQQAAYLDRPLPIGHRQTISQPYIVALMTQLVEPTRAKKALDIGTGSGYQAAVLAELVKSVHSIEIIEALANESRARLEQLNYKNIAVRHGDGYDGWESEAPFDIIIVAAAPDHLPQPLVDQLAPGGKMVIPVGKRYQELVVIDKKMDGTVVQRKVAPVAFVPMTGTAQEK